MSLPYTFGCDHPTYKRKKIHAPEVHSTMLTIIARSFLALAFLQTCLCDIYEHISQLPSLEYDFVIVGGAYLSSSQPHHH
jgi:hypothetical protein